MMEKAKPFELSGQAGLDALGVFTDELGVSADRLTKSWDIAEFGFEGIPYDRLKISGECSVAKVFDELGIQISGDLFLYRHEDRKLLKFNGAQPLSQLQNEFDTQLSDYLVRDSSNSWILCISHSGSLAVKRI